MNLFCHNLAASIDVDSLGRRHTRKRHKYICFFSRFFISLQPETKHVRIMTAIQLNAELFRTMGEIADDETLMAKLLKYAKKLAASKKADPTLMTKEEFFAKLDEAEREIAEGKGIKMLPNESLDEFLRRVG